MSTSGSTRAISTRLKGMHRLALTILCASVLFAGDQYFQSAEAKLDTLENSKAKPGSIITFSLQEINSWARYKVPEIVPQGIRNQRVTLANDSGIAYALMDFLKMRHAQGKDPGWLISHLIEGERAGNQSGGE